MSYTNGILNHDDSQGLGKIGSRGLPGIGFKLDANNDYDMQNKKLVNVKQGTNNNDVVTKSQLDSEIAKIPSVDTTQFVKKTGATMNGDLILQPQPYPIHGNTDKAISYNTARNIFLSKKEGGSMLQSLDMNNHFITNIKDPVNSDHGVNKKYVENQLEKKLDKGADIDMKNKSIINLDLPSNQRDAACVEFVNNRIDDMTQKKFLKVDGTNNMTGNLNLNEKTIINLNTDDKDIKSAANVGYVSSKVHAAKGDVTVGLKTYFDTKIKESHITSSTNKKDVFRYLMENADESSSENNIIVDGIVDFSGSLHNVNKKAYKFKMGKDAQNEYSSRIGFNMFKLPEGEYTLAIEFFPPSTTNLSVSVVSTSLNIGQQSTKLFVNYSRSIVHLQALYKFYHKQYWLHKESFKSFKKKNMACNIGSVVLIVTGTVAGGVTLNPAVLGSISGAGLILKTYSEVKNYKRKIEMCKFAYTTYEKVLTHLRSFMRGLEYNEKEFLDHVKVLDEIIIEMCPLTDKFEKKYNKVFI